MADDTIAKVDLLAEQGAPAQEAYDVLTPAVTANPDNAELLWRYARAHFDLADTKPDDKTFRQEQLTKGLAFAQKALDKDPNNFATHKWFAIMTSSVGDFQSTKEKIGDAFKIKEHALKANELKPRDPTTLHLLGRWCYGVASIGWMERKVAATLFASPPESSWDEALKYFLEANEVDPTLRRNLLFIGDTYAQLKNKDKAKEFYLKVLQLEPKTSFDHSINKEADTKLKKL
eukprot:TRINITY_DN11417_c0_g1_i1.p1 TRINITY_DN11417_c0_g1~~TRINITY_DN11417_c0_g1_i1.p1  ORF type:complete len:243 (-),score=55.15 TRINITY_DN11417_c0_g1_i1:222-917(-)